MYFGMFSAKENMVMHIILEYFCVKCNPYSVQFMGLNTPYFHVYFRSGYFIAFNKSKDRFPSHSVMKSTLILICMEVCVSIGCHTGLLFPAR